jgi:hypothetical protein
MAGVRLGIRDREHALDDERALDLTREHPRDEVDALQHHRPALLQRPLDGGLDAHEHVARLLEEAVEHGFARIRVLVGGGAACLEARVVDRRHELAREERPHRLPNEVGRRHAGDPEAVGDVGGDG